MSNPKKSGGLNLPGALIAAAGAAPLLILLWISAYAFMPADLTGRDEKTVVIPPNLFFTAIEKKLIEAGVIVEDRRFLLTARLMGVASSLKAGEYIFPDRPTPYRVLRELAWGARIQRPITIPEGATLAQIAEILGRGGWLAPERFLELCYDREFIGQLGYELASLEGYLFPETYLFERGGHSAEAIIRTMADQMRRVLAETGAEDGLPAAGLDRHQILTLASIVEKETGRTLERPLIAGVFLNRLQKGMRLQSDPTVIYGIENFDGNLTRRHLGDLTPYNTYRIAGLPPGPIGNPGRAAIEAVMQPAAGSYYYFVSKNDGSHYFSETLAEHNRAVAKYQKKTPQR
ncbi:MAG: endolytic transglycosylase MltG [Desulfurivibrionaceae bacterium]|nr:endolytic transglycosylase MltG [Desulfobulbales bacterium]MDT8334466.1 endolytic transglycosylase MltG [Desulfurivibrionaceae bacterium]